MLTWIFQHYFYHKFAWTKVQELFINLKTQIKVKKTRLNTKPDHTNTRPTQPWPDGVWQVICNTSMHRFNLFSSATTTVAEYDRRSITQKSYYTVLDVISLNTAHYSSNIHNQFSPKGIHGGGSTWQLQLYTIYNNAKNALSYRMLIAIYIRFYFT